VQPGIPEFSLQGGIQHRFGFVQPAQRLVCPRCSRVPVVVLRIDGEGLPGILQRLFPFALFAVLDAEIGTRDGIPRVRLRVEFVRGDSLIGLPVVGVVMGFDVQALALAGPVAQLESLLAVLFGFLGFSQIAVDRRQARVSQGEVGVQFYRALV